MTPNQHKTLDYDSAAERAREMIEYDGEPKLTGFWFAEARQMARAYLGLFEQYEDSERKWKIGTYATREFYEAKLTGLQEQLEAAQRTIGYVRDNLNTDVSDYSDDFAAGYMAAKGDALAALPSNPARERDPRFDSDDISEVAAAVRAKEYVEDMNGELHPVSDPATSPRCTCRNFGPYEYREVDPACAVHAPAKRLP